MNIWFGTLLWTCRRGRIFGMENNVSFFPFGLYLYYVFLCLQSYIVCVSMHVCKGKAFVLSLAGMYVQPCSLLVHLYKTTRRCSTCRCFGFMQQFIDLACYDTSRIWSCKYFANLILLNEQLCVVCAYFMLNFPVCAVGTVVLPMGPDPCITRSNPRKVDWLNKQEIQQSWQTSTVAMHLLVARLISMSIIVCLLPT